MAQARSDLQSLLAGLLSSGKVYFQPPPNVQLEFPCIVYRRADLRTEFADNSPYKRKKRYQITVIDPDPDSGIPDLVAALPLCSYERFFIVDRLNHDVYNIFF